MAYVYWFVRGAPRKPDPGPPGLRFWAAAFVVALVLAKLFA